MATMGTSDMEAMEFAIGAGQGLRRSDIDGSNNVGGLGGATSMTLPLLLVATVVWWIWQRRKADRESGLPGDFGLPFIGETLTYVAKMKTPLGNFVDLKAKR